MIIKDGFVFRENGTFEKSDIKVTGQYISDLSDSINLDVPDMEIIDASECHVIPGLIDVHMHGANGHDFCDASTDGLKAISEYLADNGITSFCPASMTLDEKKLAAIYKTAAYYHNINTGGSRLIGINMEGPFISYEKKGAQNPEYICNPDVDMYNRLQKEANGLIKIVDIAPELPGAEDFIRNVSQFVHVSLAHSTASYDKASEAFKLGADHVTHLFNAMGSFNHRDTGIYGAAFDNNAYVEIIADGIHNSSSAVRMALKLYGSDHLIFISDSTEATGLSDGKYSLGGQRIIVSGNKASLPDGIIAGSVTNLMDCLKNSVDNMGFELGTAVKCSTVTPAKSIDLFDKIGSIDTGKDADIVILNKDLTIRNVIIKGKVYK